MRLKMRIFTVATPSALRIFVMESPIFFITTPPATLVKGPSAGRLLVALRSSNQCTGRAGVECDEYPYASTYDGGLGCYPDGYNGPDHLAQSGASRCANKHQNGLHGQKLKQFYANTLNNNNGQRLVTSDDRWDRQLQSMKTRHAQRATLNASTAFVALQPVPPSCPARFGHRRAVEDGSSSNSTDTLPFQILFRNVTAESGRVVTVPYRQDEADEMESLLAVGQPIWTHDDDGNGIAEKIVTSSLME
ncbi:hypothetical protein DFH11DRAFT_1548431 [Phellopilus nigrolimitatus]|nr:hypothetical protein DFH11DRAFT_1548431 [Phellopilus nigrolimitatus]